MAAEAVDLLIVNHNTQEKLERLLDTLHEDDDCKTWKLYLADNGSTDGSKYWILNNASRYRIERVHMNVNIGYAAAVNGLANKSYSRYLAAINADTWFNTEDIASVIERFKIDPNIAVVGTKQCDEDSRIRHAGIVGSNVNPKHRGWGALDRYDRTFRDVIDCVTVSGSAYFMRRDTWDEMTNCQLYRAALARIGKGSNGAFLPTPHFFEETWYSYHVREHGYRVVYDGNISIGHTWRASTGASPKLKEYFKESKKLFVTACETHGIEHD